MDIEGGGVLALQGALRCIKEGRPLCYFELHSPEEDRSIAEILTSCDYQAFKLNDQKWVERADMVYPDARGVSGNLLVCPSELQQQLANILSVVPVQWTIK